MVPISGLGEMCILLLVFAGSVTLRLFYLMTSVVASNASKML